MTETKRDLYPQVAHTEKEPTGWVGWILFAGIMMLLVGSFQAIAGFVALFKDTYFLSRSADLAISIDYTGWGWIHLGLGALAVLAGFGVMVGQMWARIFGILLAFVSAAANLAFAGAYPLWSVTMIVLDVIVIWALAVHGREVKAAR